jgi:DNA-binding response OmpR family regulator
MKTVVIADNDKNLLEQFDNLISSLNFFAATADNSEDLFRILNIVQADIVLCAADLKRMPTDCLCRQLLSTVGSTVPIILMSDGKPVSDDITCSMIIEKPVNFARIKNLILNLTPEYF